MPRSLAAALVALLAVAVLAAPIPAHAGSPASGAGTSTTPARAVTPEVTIRRPVEGDLVRWPVAQGRTTSMATVEMRRHDGKLLGTAETRSGGYYRVEPTGYLGSGPLSFRVVMIDTSGVRTSSALRTVQVDRTLLNRPQLIAGPGPVSLSDWSLGHVGATRTVRGIGVRGTAVHATLDGTTIAGTPDVRSNWEWKVRLPDSVTEGPHALVVTLTDQAGHKSLPLSTTVTLDVQVPKAPTITVPAADAVFEDVPGPVTGTGEPGTRLAIFVDGRYLGWSPVDSDGRWSWWVDEYDVEGRGGHWLAVNQQDQAGNKSERTGIRFVIRPPVKVAG